MTQDYYGTKRITAWIADKDGIPGYSVKYADGYISWSPKDTFEKSYQPLNALSFGHAILALKAGHRVRRAGWNGEGVFLIYVPGTKDVMPRGGSPYASLAVSPSGVVDINPHIDMKTATGEMQPGWLASQTDMLANDWQIIE
jgi:hypothetical protein